ncbi:hypothetical protein Tco_1169675, partial [Tanacetum coccineum]
RKALLLGDKQIPSVGVCDEVYFYTLFQALGRHLEEIHVTWAQFWKKSDKIANWHKEGLKIDLQKVETTSGFFGTPSGFAKR